LIFPEIDYDKIDQPRGMDISIVTTARTDDEGRAFLAAFGFPFKKEGDEGFLAAAPQKQRRGQGRGPQGKSAKGKGRK
jgi:hypothetical protein